jgi:hypothetical protein
MMTGFFIGRLTGREVMLVMCMVLLYPSPAKRGEGRFSIAKGD